LAALLFPGAEFVARLHKSLPKIFTSSGDQKSEDASVVKSDDSEDQIRKIYEDWAERCRFEYCDLTVPGSEEAGGVAYIQ
jgi:hypothetical protein